MTIKYIGNNGNYKGSITNYQRALSIIKVRYGDKEAENYDPRKNCFTYKKWKELGYQVKKGEKSIKVITFIRKIKKDDKTEKDVVTKSYPKTVCLFFYLQVKKKEAN